LTDGFESRVSSFESDVLKLDEASVVGQAETPASPRVCPGQLRVILHINIPNEPLAACWKTLLQAAQKDSETRRAKNRRAEAYLAGTLERGDWAQRSIWVFFSSLPDLRFLEARVGSGL